MWTIRQRSTRLVYWLGAAVLCLPCGAALGQKETAGATPSAAAQHGQTALDFKQLVLSLRNDNPAPKILGRIPDQDALFAPEYKWSEYKRVLSVIQTLIDHVEAAWPALIDGIDDERYCITLVHDASIHNHSVGNVCRILLQENLTQAFKGHLPGREAVHFQLRLPESIGYEGFKSWCLEQHRKGRSLVELQIEMCEWAIKKLPTIPYVPEDEVRESLADMKAQVETLRTTGKPVLMRKITIPDIRTLCSEERAERVRRKYQGK